MMPRRRPLRLPPATPTGVVLAVIMIAAFALRLFGLNWDSGYLLHPDELHVINTASMQVSLPWPIDWNNLLDPDQSTLNPRGIDSTTGEVHIYAYGALPVYVADASAWALSQLTGRDWQSYLNGIHFVGRFLSALLDTLTVLVVFAIGSRGFNRRTGVIAALIYACSPLSIQLAHFFTTDAWLTFFVTLTLWTAIRSADGGRPRDFALAGLLFGFAMATKASVIGLVAVIVVAVMWDMRERWLGGQRWLRIVQAGAVRLMLPAIASIAGFALWEPYALTRLDVYLDQLTEQSEMIKGVFDVPFSRQYVGTTPVLYQAEQLIRWGLGPVLGLLCLAGIVWLLPRMMLAPNATSIVLASWIAIQGVIVLTPETKFMRYFAPLLPVAAIAGAAIADRLLSAQWRAARRRLAMGTMIAALALIGAWTAAFSSVWAAPNPRIAASIWMYENVPAGSVIAGETWDYLLPVSFHSGLTPEEYGYAQLTIDLYTDRAPELTAGHIWALLERADYVVLASNRSEKAVEAAPWRYAVQSAYLQHLRAGDLGFDLVATFDRSPRLPGITFDDQAADESLLNYDHPRILIFRKSSSLTFEQFTAILAPAIAAEWVPERHQTSASLHLDRPPGDLPAVDVGRWSAAVTGSSVGALVVWILFLLLLRAIGRPLIAAVMPHAADRGAGFARLAVLLLAGYLMWIAASLKLLPFSSPWTIAAFATIGLAALRLHVRRRQDPSPNRRLLLAGEAVFWATFLVFLIFRIINPDSWHPYWGGEKPMEFAHLNAILRSAHFPPVDPWYSGGYINYYYYGTYLIALCIKATGIPSEIAFNLAQPTVIAIIASGAFSIGATLTSALNRRRYAVTGGVAAGLGVIFVGNLHAVVMTVRWLNGGLPPEFYDWTWAASRAISGAITEFPYFTALYADLHAHVIAWPITLLIVGLGLECALDSRTLLRAIGRRGAHGAAATYAGRILMLGIALGALATTNAWDVAIYAALTVVAVWLSSRWISWPLMRLTVVIGVVSAIGVLAIGLYLPFFRNYVALFGSLERTRSETLFHEWTTHMGGWAIVIIVGGLALLARNGGQRWPRLAQDPSIPLALAAALAIVALLPAMRETTAARFAAIALIALFASLIVVALANGADAGSRLGSRLSPALAAMGGLAAILIALTDRLTLGASILILTLGAGLWFARRDAGSRFLGALIAAGAAVMAGVELVFLVDDLAPDDYWYRMNTVFKFYNQVWMLLGLSAAVVAVSALARWRSAEAEALADPSETPADTNELARAAAAQGQDTVVAAAFADQPPDEWAFAKSAIAVDDEPPLAATADDPQPAPETTPVLRKRAAPSLDVARIWSLGTVVVALAVVVAGAFYPVFATGPRLIQRFDNQPNWPTLNALDWMRYGTLRNDDGVEITFSADRAAIQWLNDNVSGTPVIAEASIGPYRGNGSRFSIATGLPTILGWERHEEQQRYLTQLEGRFDDVRLLYASDDPAVKEEILRRYGVAYVIVGDVERYTQFSGIPYSTPEGIAAFDGMVGTVLEVAFQSGATTIYRVLPPAEPAG